MTAVNIVSEDGKKEPNKMRKAIEKIKSVFNKKEPNDHKEDSSETSPYLTKALNEDLSFSLFKIEHELNQRNFILQKHNDILQGQDEKIYNLVEKWKDMRSKTFLLHEEECVLRTRFICS
ncbi:PREDICTED: VAMP-like protein YKT61 [Camelina sativa]|uniref:VAMP-like protein YKT61 n=1 Tax=Camelina sativa TaxID=90675 RepID=A0ABM1R9G6_CAMSA|nr:PREDICTED: VAMP-like protein YKT61 [Camelina sativa]